MIIVHVVCLGDVSDGSSQTSPSWSPRELIRELTRHTSRGNTEASLMTSVK